MLCVEDKDWQVWYASNAVWNAVASARPENRKKVD